MIDLKPFCSTGDVRPELEQPWSHGAWTYATDGRVLVRVPRRDDVPDRDVKSQAAAEGFFAEPARSDWQDCPALPEPVFATCKECDGGNSVTDKCKECDGCGNARQYELGVAVKLNGVALNSVYLRKLAVLPGIKIATGSPSGPVHFIFDGGEGRLMTMRLS